MTKFEIIFHLVNRYITGYTLNDPQYNKIKEIKLNDDTNLIEIYKEYLGEYICVTASLYKDLAVTLFKRKHHKIPTFENILKYI